MAKITIEELSESLKNYLDGLGLTEAQVQELIDKMQEEVIGNKAELATSNKSTIVAAINELFQNANNGKELIASAIGEPLSAENTFNAMSNGINGLLSTFKTNMMNNGVAVEANDKFKQLIDKIAALKDGEGKGIQFVEGTIDSAASITRVFHCADTGTMTRNYVVIPKMEFEPTFLILFIYGHTTNTWVSILSYDENFEQPTVKVCSFNGGIESSASTYHIKADENVIVGDTIYLPIWGNNTNLTFKYYAVGVGEGEDSTLRDSLASILEEEGVEVLEEDTMADLIVKVDEEFDRKKSSAGLDIISASSLPATGRENQICVITNNPNQNIKITNLMSEVTDSSYIYGILGDGTSNIAGNITIGDKVSVIYHMDGFFQNNTRLLSYIYRDGSWQSFTKSGIYIITNKEYSADSLIYGTFPTHTNTATGDVSFEMEENYGLWVANYSSNMYYYSFLPTPIDISAFNKVVLKYSISSYGNTPTQRLQIVCSKTKPTNLSGRCNSTSLPAYCEDDFAYTSTVYGKTQLSGSLSGLSGTYYIGIMHYYGDSYGSLYVSDFYLE